MTERRIRPHRSPARRPLRQRTHDASEHARPPRHPAKDVPAEPAEETITKTGGGGASGFGPIDDDGDRWRREPDGGDDRGPLLIVLGILSLGAAVLTARLLTMRTERGGFARWRPR